MIRANRENREWENEAWDKQEDKAGESREQAQEDPIQKRENGQTDITGKNGNHIELISIIGEIEGHENLSGNTKTTKYEHILPKLAEIEEMVLAARAAEVTASITPPMRRTDTPGRLMAARAMAGVWVATRRSAFAGRARAISRFVVPVSRKRN